MDQPLMDAPKYSALLEFMEENSGEKIKKRGCMNEKAENYDKEAEVNEGCIYKPANITKGGGIINAGQIKLNFLENSVSNQTNISVTQVLEKIKDSFSIGPEYKLEPSGIKFEVPISICINLTLEELDLVSNKSLAIYICNAEKDAKWNKAEDNYQNNTLVCGKISHFSYAAVMEDNLYEKTIYGSTLNVSLGMLFSLFLLIIAYL
jgi:hypothetical protein